MVDGGATSHIVNDIKKFKSFDDAFQPDSHSMELADRMKCSQTAQRRGTVTTTWSPGTTDIHENNNLYYLPTVQDNFDKCKVCHDVQTWHGISLQLE